MKKRVADLLLNLGCFQFRPKEPFQYASGLKGPIYCDNRLILSHVAIREEIIRFFLQQIQQNVKHFDLVAGMATAGIPYAAWLAHELKKPLIYVRLQSKAHGKQNLIEGDWRPDQSLILIEDLVNQGKSSVQGVDILTQSGLKTKALFCIVDYEMEVAKNEFSQRNCPLFSLTSFSALVERAQEKGLIDSYDLALVNRWHQNPAQDYLGLIPSP